MDGDLIEKPDQLSGGIIAVFMLRQASLFLLDCPQETFGVTKLPGRAHLPCPLQVGHGRVDLGTREAKAQLQMFQNASIDAWYASTLPSSTSANFTGRPAVADS